MPRPILFSQTYPSYHPRKGESTFFVEKIWKYLADKADEKSRQDLNDFFESEMFASLSKDLIFPKYHTIRSGHRWKTNDVFSPRIWSGPAYRSKQIQFAKDLQIHHVWDIMILPSYEVFINGQVYGFYGSPEVDKLAIHDGLSPVDFQHWFSKLPFDGQIICWDADIGYE